MLSDKSTLSDDLARVLRCYFIGIAALIVLFSIPQLLLPFFMAFGVGFAVGLPVLFAALIAVALFRSNIQRHRAVWCCAAPFLAVAVNAVLARMILSPRTQRFNEGWDALLSSSEVQVFLGMTFLSAAIGARVFFNGSAPPEYPIPDVQQPEARA